MENLLKLFNDQRGSHAWLFFGACRALATAWFDELHFIVFKVTVEEIFVVWLVAELDALPHFFHLLIVLISTLAGGEIVSEACVDRFLRTRSTYVPILDAVIVSVLP